MSKEQLFVSKYKCMCKDCYKLHKAKVIISLDVEFPFQSHDTCLNIDGKEYINSQIDSIDCKRCGSNNLVLIDDKIAKAVQILNMKGYKTKFSCEGHLCDHDGYDYSLPYIVFEEDVPLDIFNTLPDGWYLDTDNLKLGTRMYYHMESEDSKVAIDFNENQLINWAFRVRNSKYYKELKDSHQTNGFSQLAGEYKGGFKFDGKFVHVDDIDRSSMLESVMIECDLFPGSCANQIIDSAKK